MLSWKNFLLFSVFVFLLVQVSIPYINASNEETVSASIAEAEEALASSYEAVLAAEQAGANVSDLSAQFNVCCEYLSTAHMWYQLGNFENADYFAGLCQDIAEDIKYDALELKTETEKIAGTDFVASTVVSVVGIVVVLVSSFIVWRFFKRFYYQRILGEKSEVVANGS